MDQTLLNYLQQLQQVDQNQSRPQGQSPSNPFDIGISKAIASARESLGMTQKQQDKALRSSMLAFANNMSQQPKARGFFDNFSAVGRALAPAIAAHDQEEEAALIQNNALANQILAYQAAEQQAQAAEEQRAWQRQHAENQLEEQRRSHNLLNNFRRDKLDNQTKQNNLISSSNKQEEAIDPKMQSKIWKTRAVHNITKIIPEISLQFERNEEILPVIEELKDVLQNSSLAGSSKKAEFRRYIAKLTGADEDILKAKNLGQFYLEWLSNNTKGVLSDKDIAIYSAGFADIEKNPAAGLDILNRLQNKLTKQQGSYAQRLKLYDEDPGANLSEINLLKKINQGSSSPPFINNGFQLPTNGSSPPFINNDVQLPTNINQDENEFYVELLDPETGETKPIHREDVPKGLKRGLIEVK